MNTWLILPRDPLIFRNGKPFTAAPGSRSETLVFPFPSTIAGAVRTMAGKDPKSGQFDKEQIKSLMKKTILGPILVELDRDGQIIDYFFPAPADALLFKTGVPEKAECFDLKPLMVSDAQVDQEGLKICGPARLIKKKPHNKAPSYWRWDAFLDWLMKPQNKPVTLTEIGIRRLPQEARTHAGIDADNQTAEDGALFQTSALEFTLLDRNEDDPYDLRAARRFGMLALTDAEFPDGVDHLGGERRIVRWEVGKEIFSFQSCPCDLKSQILDDGYCRLILITPAFFEAGFLPAKLNRFGVTIEAVVNKRYQGVSGWDYEKKKPKPTRRLTPAGSVYFIKLPEEEEKRAKFIDSVWLKTVSDDEQLCRDGFGLAVLGIWDGNDRKLELEVKA